ncbi:MAG: two-component sensor histidine kinase, partial [Planctomycetes bacterium]|nr:two-component sensor histidine kinase [Planctomycetota bacterium]
VGNLMTDALRHTATGGRITVRVKQDQGQAVLEVVETGCGIAAIDLPHVYERFYRADPSRSSQSGGVGLGLAIFKCIMELHHGALEIVSSLGQETLATLRFPCATADRQGAGGLD